jgi:hypothetical protein
LSLCRLNLIADAAIRISSSAACQVDAARGLPLGLADKVTLALAEPEALPKEGNLRAATMRTEMGTITCARSASPASKASSAAALPAARRRRRTAPSARPRSTRSQASSAMIFAAS